MRDGIDEVLDSLGPRIGEMMKDNMVQVGTSGSSANVEGFVLGFSAWHAHMSL